MRRIVMGLAALAVGVGCSDVTGQSRPADDESAVGEVSAALTFEQRAALIIGPLAAYTYVPDAVQGPHCDTEVMIAFASLYQGTNLAQANQRLVTINTEAYLPEIGDYDTIKCLFALPLLLRTYLHPVTSARLDDNGRNAIRDMMWRLIKNRSKLADADPTKTWSLYGSENIDAMMKSSYLLATNALRGTKYENVASYPLSDAGTLVDHQNAWRSYWKEYFKQRAREGINTEYASAGYAKHSLSAYYNVRDFAGSAIVRDQAEKFLTLYWADVAQDFVRTTGMRGGAQARSPKEVYKRQNGVKPHSWLYHWHDNDDWLQAQELSFPTVLMAATSSYRPPAVVTAVATDEDRSVFAYASRRPGYLKTTPVMGVIYDIGFAPGGTSLQRRYTFNTSDYVLGTMKTQPRVVPAKSVAGYQNSGQRWMGVHFAESAEASIAVFGRGSGGDGLGRGYAEIIGDAGYDVMVAAKDPSAEVSDGVRILVSHAVWNNGQIGHGKWLFLRSGNGFAAIGLANGGYVINTVDHGQLLELTDQWSPIVIQMGQASQYTDPPEFEPFVNFQHSVRGRPQTAEYPAIPANVFSYENGVLTYQAEHANDVYVIHSGQSYDENVGSYPLPTVNGGGSVSPAKTYSSPYIQGIHGENTVTLSHPDHPSVVLDFSY